jgi:hypothetical protein
MASKYARVLLLSNCFCLLCGLCAQARGSGPSVIVPVAKPVPAASKPHNIQADSLVFSNPMLRVRRDERVTYVSTHVQGSADAVPGAAQLANRAQVCD